VLLLGMVAKKKKKMGRPQLAKNKLLSRRVFVKLTAAHHYALAAMARERGTTVGELAREILVIAVSIDLERKRIA